ncbi:MAG: EamA family transporter RarD [Alphaproteobacteria bacterium]|nr:EamA family transporter RarD [Alphaproteobacteria bacterium]
MPPEPAAGSAARAGYLYGLAAFVFWGVVPVFFKWLGHVPALELTAHRILWSVPFLALLAIPGGRLSGLGALLTVRRLLVFAVSAVAISSSWLIYIWAIAAERLLEASLGYYIAPLMLVVLGVAFLKERPTWRQWTAIALAAVGVATLVFRFGAIPWVALGLAATQPAYALIRKLAPADPISGLLLETILLSPAMLGMLIWLGSAGATAHADLATWVLLAASGVVTAVPMIWFIAAARRLPLVAISLMQFISPSLNFLLAVGLFGEEFTTAHMVAFAFIWAALALHTVESVRRRS